MISAWSVPQMYINDVLDSVLANDVKAKSYKLTAANKDGRPTGKIF